MLLTQKPLPTDQYFQDVHTKRQIVLHHTAGGDNPFNVIHGWAYTPERVGTAFVVAGDRDKTGSYQSGQILQAFDEKYWAYHLGLKTSSNMLLNQGSIGIEIDNYGPLILKDGKYLTYLNTPIDEKEVIELDYKGFKFYHKYTDDQVAAVKELLLILTDRYKIPKTFNADMFAVNNKAMSGEAGIWSHTSYRNDKFDVSPQSHLIEMLKSL